MIEQRWRELGRNEGHQGPVAIVPGQHGLNRYFVLQYRQQYERGSYVDESGQRQSMGLAWSEWRDAPVEWEKK